MNQSRVWWSVKIFTSTHIVMDDGEAGDTTCTLFFDDTQDTSRRVDFIGRKLKWGSSTVELALLEMDTCNEEVAKNLFAEIKRFNTNWKVLHDRYKDDKDMEKLVIIVSHPHGGAKRVSVGFGVDVGQEMNLGYSKYIYTTPTCMGSCGAPVYILGKDWFRTEYVHLGTFKCGVSIATSETIDKGEIPEIYKKHNNYSARWYYQN
ncbi:hypothetical protein BgiBS90_018936 [Biomphalaria glabrata]|nr:hypothetical protein BgiBS90_018936 [Biomphalaria glabrata]